MDELSAVSSRRSGPPTPGREGPTADRRPLTAPQHASARFLLWPLSGAAPRPVPGARPGEFALNFSPDGRTLFTSVTGELPPRIYRIDLATGARTLWRELSAPDPAGIAFAVPMQITQDGALYAFTYLRLPADLFLVEGLR